MKKRDDNGAKAPRRRAHSKKDKALKQKKLLEAALELFTTNGYNGTAIETITDRAGESTGTFYLYFRNKVDIYRALNREGIQILDAMVRDAASWPGMNAVGRISAVVQAYYRFFTDYRGYYQIIHILHIGQRDFAKDTENVAELNRMAESLLRFLATVVQEGIDAGELNPVDPWQATHVLWRMLDGMFLMAINKNLDFPGIALDTLIKQGLEMFLQGLLRKGPKFGVES